MKSISFPPEPKLIFTKKKLLLFKKERRFKEIIFFKIFRKRIYHRNPYLSENIFEPEPFKVKIVSKTKRFIY